MTSISSDKTGSGPKNGRKCVKLNLVHCKFSTGLRSAPFSHYAQKFTRGGGGGGGGNVTTAHVK